MTPQIVIPYLSMPWCLEDCIESFGPTDVPVLVVDNSPGCDTEAMEFPPNVEVEVQGRNAGIAASWNLGLRKGADQTIVCSQLVRLAPADLARRVVGEWGMDALVREFRAAMNPWGCTFSDQGFHFISIGRRTVDAIGEFDENLFPAYGEDDEYHHRMDLAGIRFGASSWKGVWSIAYAVQKRSGAIAFQPDGRMRCYYTHKWGSIPGHFERPFGNPDNPLSYWPEVWKP